MGAACEAAEARRPFTALADSPSVSCRGDKWHVGVNGVWGACVLASWGSLEALEGGTAAGKRWSLLVAGQGHRHARSQRGEAHRPGGSSSKKNRRESDEFLGRQKRTVSST